MMIKSINLWGFDLSRPLPDIFRRIRAAGFDAVELIVDETGPLHLQSTPDECRRVAAQARECGLQISSLATTLTAGRYSLSSSDEVLAQAGVECISRVLHIAQEMEIDAILMIPGMVTATGGAVPGAPYDAAYKNALRALRDLKPVAEATGVAIGVENVWNKFLLSPLEMCDFLDTIGSEKVGCYFDVGNVVLTGFPEQWIRILGERIIRVHFKDFRREVGTAAGFCDLLEGDVDYTAVMSALRTVGYSGFVTAEMDNADRDLAKISAAMDAILQM